MNTPSIPARASVPVPSDSKIWQVIAASAVGTMIEWYDFYIFGSLATRDLAALLSAAATRRWR